MDLKGPSFRRAALQRLVGYVLSSLQGKDIDEKVDATLDRLLVEFGKEILKIVPGKVSTEVDARFSFDVQGSINKALHIIDVCLEIRALRFFADLG